MKTELEIQLAKLLKPLCSEHGLELWGIHIGGGNKKILQIFIDSENGTNIEQCTTISQELSVILDAEDLIKSAYTLEISSPGLERQFFELEQLQKYIGQKIKITCLASTPGRKNFNGVLQNIDKEENELILEVDGQNTRVKWDSIKKARLIYPFTLPNI